MSKSYGNAIYLKDTAEIIRTKIAPMVTDTRRKRRSDPGEPNDCPSSPCTRPSSRRRTGGPGRGLPDGGRRLSRLQEGRHRQAHRVPDPVLGEEEGPGGRARPGLDILEAGNAKATRTARKTMDEVRSAIGF